MEQALTTAYYIYLGGVITGVSLGIIFVGLYAGLYSIRNSVN